MLSQPPPLEFDVSSRHGSSLGSGVGEHPTAGEVPSQLQPEETTGISDQRGEGEEG